MSIRPDVAGLCFLALVCLQSGTVVGSAIIGAFSCEGRTYGNYAHPDCTKFYMCGGNGMHVMDCPASLHYNAATDQCDWPANVQCGNEVSTDAPTTLGSTPVPSGKHKASLLFVRLQLQRSHIWQLRSHDCTKFYMCGGNGMHVMDCPASLHYNAATDQCDWPANVQCGNEVSTDAPTTLGSTPVPSGAFSCRGRTYGNYAHPDCTKFYMCGGNGMHVMDCPASLHYNAATDQCDWPANVQCGKEVSTTLSDSWFHACSISCIGRTYGNYAHTDCTKFYMCGENGMHVMDCPDSLHYNAATDQCDWPANVQCGNEVSIDAPTTLGSTPVPSGAFSCIGRTYGNYAHTDCTKFYMCGGNGMHVMDCPDSLHYNAATDQCDWPANVKCGKEVSMDAPTTLGSTPVPSGAFSCLGRTYGNYAHTDCTKFYMCGGNGMHVMDCPDSLHYNAATDQCDWPANVQCGKEVSTDSPTTLGSTPVPSGAFSCIGRTYGNYAHTDCTKFYMCGVNGMHVMDCPDSLHYNAATDQCDWPANVQCGKEVSIDAPTTLGSTPVPSGAFSCIGRTYGNYAHTDCTKFYMCGGNGMHVMDCPDSLHYNAATDQCDWPANVQCGNEVSTDAPTTLGSTPVPSGAFSCIGRTYGNYAHTDCTQFYMCRENGMHVMDCPDSLHYNAATDQCDWPANVQCGKEVSMDAPTTLGSTPVPSGAFSCIGRTYGNYAHTDCTKFYMCGGNGMHVMDCPDSLHYNAATDQCDWPANVQCGKEVSMDAPTTLGSTPVPSGAFSCRGRTYGNYAHPDCTKFYMCGGNGMHVMDCPASLHYNAATDQCDWPANVQCGNEVSTDAPTTLGSTPVPSGAFSCRGRTYGNYAHPDCTKFYMCGGNGMHVMDCPASLHYNAATDQCDWPANVQCWNEVSTAVPTTLDSTPVPSGAFSCRGRTYGNYAHPDCTKFYMCGGNGMHVMDCPASLHYNAATDQCDWPANVQCGHEVSTDAPTTPGSTPVSQGEHFASFLFIRYKIPQRLPFI
ncbi:chitin-binding domain protein cbd-1-like [Mya arenaria]|uniref:chitin-binding domain protein cbd-1-like n=1 Tax=Mya arenaria TaxID=6604 RepID=UPI0022E00CE0|nr:chitin-binding domain protein cbd-1-like [Mya arenaria]